MGSTDRTPFPLAADEVTPDLLTEVLGRNHPGIQVESVAIVDAAVHGQGSTSTADRLTLDLEFAAPGPALPGRMLLKTMLVEPHVPLTMYENEVRFYREIRPGIKVETPTVYAADFDSATGRFGILMEDLTTRGATFPQATGSLSVEQMATALDVLADLHSAHWASARLAGEWSWLPTASGGGMADVFRTPEWFEHVRTCVESNPTKQHCLAEIGRPLEQVWRDVWRLIEGGLTAGPPTLLHGDSHMANIYLLPGDRVGLLDWQLASAGSWAQDFTYLMVTALDPELRRENERALLDHYLEGLRARGVTSAPNREPAWQAYRRSVMWGFAIGWLGCPAQNYPTEVMDANLTRLAAAVRDLDTVAAIHTD